MRDYDENTGIGWGDPEDRGESKHTPGPWRAIGCRPTVAKICAGGNNGLVADVSAYWFDTGQAEANADRIVACVNACEGINPDAVPGLLAALMELEEAASCLEADVDSAGTNHDRAKIVRFACIEARAAIADATE